jgi:exodeoxyribonuclease VII large subunit
MAQREFDNGEGKRAAAEGNTPRVLGVGELLTGLRGLLEQRVGRQWVMGEVSNLHRASSGHAYFTLKDETGQIRAALFRNAARRIPFEPENGLEVVIFGDVTVYEARGDLQLIVREIHPRGQGALQLAFEQLRRKLEAEGLFDPASKRALPEFPERIGVVTSITGAALHDILNVTGLRFPGIPILIAPTLVQGVGAEFEIAAAIDALAEREDVSVIVVARGGGSLEDLKAFNTEVVARAIVRSPVPIVSGVGHEVDITIADLAADARAATPSAAAALVVPDRGAKRAELLRGWRRLSSAMRGSVRALSATLERESEALRILAPSARLAAQRARFLVAVRAMTRAVQARLESARSELAIAAPRLDALSPLAVLDRGYALVRRASDGAIVREASEVPVGEKVSIRLARAVLEARVETSRVPES